MPIDTKVCPCFFQRIARPPDPVILMAPQYCFGPIRLEVAGITRGNVTGGHGPLDYILHIHECPGMKFLPPNNNYSNGRGPAR